MTYLLNPYEHPCKLCGQMFLRKSHAALYCSKECRKVVRAPNMRRGTERHRRKWFLSPFKHGMTQEEVDAWNDECNVEKPMTVQGYSNSVHGVKATTRKRIIK